MPNARRKGVFGAPMREPALRAWDAPWRDNVAQKVSRVAGRLGGNERNAYQGVKSALGVADWLPGVGDAAAGVDAIGSFRAGDYLKGAAQSGLAAVGLVPGVGDGLAAVGKGLLGKFIAASAVPVAKKARIMGNLPSPSVLSIPRAPSLSEMRKLSQVQRVPLNQARRGNKLEWDRFNKGDYGVPLLKGYESRPVAVRLENGEHVVLDGNHRTAIANGEGRPDMEMHVISAKDYDPANAGRAPTKNTVNYDDLLAELFGG